MPRHHHTEDPGNGRSERPSDIQRELQAPALGARSGPHEGELSPAALLHAGTLRAGEGGESEHRKAPGSALATETASRKVHDKLCGKSARGHVKGGRGVVWTSRGQVTGQVMWDGSSPSPK